MMDGFLRRVGGTATLGRRQLAWRLDLRQPVAFTKQPFPCYQAIAGQPWDPFPLLCRRDEAMGKKARCGCRADDTLGPQEAVELAKGAGGTTLLGAGKAVVGTARCFVPKRSRGCVRLEKCWWCTYLPSR